MKPTTQAIELADIAPTLHITTPGEAAKATEFLSRANKTLDALKAEEEKITAPLNEALRAARAPLAEPKKRLKETIALLRERLSNYQTLATKQALEETQKIAKRMANKTLRPETAIKKLDEIDSPLAKVETQTGSLTFRPKQVLKIVDFSKVPRAYLMVNEELALSALKANMDVPGCTIEIVQVPINRRN